MASQSQVESDLAKLKQEIGTGDDAKALETGGEDEPAAAEPAEEKQQS